jgi:alpha-L-rhamnosidase
MPMHNKIIFAKRVTVLVLAIIATALFTGMNNASKKSAVVYDLKIDHLNEPLALENPSPRFSWKIKTDKREFRQTAYQILVATDEKLLSPEKADCWNSGKVKTGQTIHIPYQGRSLESGKSFFWKVRVWNENDRPGKFSRVNRWEMGLLNAGDWKASWISDIEPSDSVPPLLPAPYFRKEFSTAGNISSARLYISGLGYYEAFINGKKVGDHVLDPVKTHYDRRVKYITYDVTDYLKKGNNAIGVVLGNGWYNQHTREAWNFDKAPWRGSPKVIAQLVLKDKNGKEILVGSDETWKFSTGPIVFDGIHNGETYDARLELGNWSQAGYDDSGWQKALKVEGPGGKFSAQLMPPIRITGSVNPAKTWKLNDTVSMVDLGQNITGWARIKVRGPAGSRVKLRYGERIFDDGLLDQVELQRFIWTGDTQTGRYILSGEGIEEWHAVFAYHGFQYIEVTLSTSEIELLEIQGDVVHTDLKETGFFECSNEMFNKIHQNLKWSFLGNYHGYPTDCPHREKMGWTGDALLVAEAGLFNFDMIHAYLKWIDDFTDEQQPNGQLPGIIPTSGWGYTYGRNEETRPRGYGPQWEGAFIEIPWQMYLSTGDISIIEMYYDGFTKYMGYLTAHSKNHLLDFGIDDHKQLENLTFGDYLSSAFYFRFAGILAEMAKSTGRTADAENYRRLASDIKKSFNEEYFHAETGIYLHGGQTPMGIALYFGLVPEKEQDRVLQNFLKEIERKNGHIDAGVVGTKAVINALLKYEQDQILFEMANKKTFPGWGCWIEELGATTLYQNWDGSQSQNHIMFGSIGDYFYKGLAGINIDEKNPGYRNIIIRPSVNNDVQWVKASRKSPYGTIESAWKKQGNEILMDFKIPVNATATVFVPGEEKRNVLSFNAKESEYLGYKNGHHIYNVAYGNYSVKSVLD